MTFEQAEEIRARYAKGDILQRELGEEYGLHQASISMIIRGRWKGKKPVCSLCDTKIAHRIRPGKDGVLRCANCQPDRTRKLNAEHMAEALKGAKAEQYKGIRKRAKRAWEARNPEGKRSRSLIKSVKRRLLLYGQDPNRFRRPSTRELAEAIKALPELCITCGTAEDLTIQHIKSVVHYPELALDGENLTTMCRSCNTRDFYVN